MYLHLNLRSILKARRKFVINTLLKIQLILIVIFKIKVFSNSLFVANKVFLFIERKVNSVKKDLHAMEKDLQSQEKRIGVIGIVIENLEQAPLVNDILHQHGNIIVGRLGLPYREKGINIISLIVDGTTDEIGALNGKLGKINGVNVKSALSKKIF